MIPVLLVVGGLGLLVSGAEILVRGAVSLAALARIPPVVIGLTVVAAGTSLPELFVSISSALAGQPDLATGNVVGSNLYNIGLILGVSALVTPLTVSRDTRTFEWPAVMLAALLLWLVGRDGTIHRADGLILLAAHLAFLVALAVRVYRGRQPQDAPEVAAAPHAATGWLAVTGVVLGLGALSWGSRLLVDGATDLAEQLGLSERVIGLTVVALGTSLPELATSVAAAWRGQSDIAVGNVLGSNLFNVLAILGLTATITSVPVHPRMLAWDIPWMGGLTLLLLPLMVRGRLGRLEGAVLLAAIALYTAMMG